jgi:hypothetical protein
MSAGCAAFHELARLGTRHGFPFEKRTIPLNGIYVLFERGEEGHGGSRIVRAGTHRGDRQLPSRMCQHFVIGNKDRSIFRKNVGRALLNAAGDAYLAEWNKDRTSRESRQRFGTEPDSSKRQMIEADVTRYLQNFTFTVFAVENKARRLELESRVISTVSLCDECRPSAGWLGLSSPKARIRESGLWLVNELFKEPLSAADVHELTHALR